LPGDAFSDRVLLRSIQFAASDPVSFALLDGRRTASFPRVPGFAAPDSARRAVHEHAAWLASWTSNGPQPDAALDLLFTAARAALFLESVGDDEALLPLTAEATVAFLGERHPEARATAEDAYGAFRAVR